ncbi:MAG: hypothetical protein Q4P36_05850 [Bowdeniella nasicola]|nr:hypothetical protein [Bowdeniella nasicola]
MIWIGDNEMSANRRRNLGALRERLGLPVELVTRESLPRWVLPDHPLHPAWEHLSLVHQSDYLRAYLMHHHGGGYCDLKEPAGSWERAFDHMAANEDIWITGYRELSSASPVRLPGRLGVDIALNYRRLIGLGAYLTRSATPLTAEWLREVERRMSYYADQASEFPGGTRGEVVGYPVSWTRLLGGVLQPLQLKYLRHVRIDDSLLLRFVDYQ